MRKRVRKRDDDVSDLWREGQHEVLLLGGLGVEIVAQRNNDDVHLKRLQCTVSASSSAYLNSIVDNGRFQGRLNALLHKERVLGVYDSWGHADPVACLDSGVVDFYNLLVSEPNNSHVAFFRFVDYDSDGVHLHLKYTEGKGVAAVD